MAKYELPIYGENDEILKTYETDHIRWGLFVEACKINEDVKDKPIDEQLFAINKLIQKVFAGLTDEHLMLADASDIFNTFEQLQRIGSGINGGSKNG